MGREARNRQALLDAAIRCIQERGYARTTARDLVAASRTNLGAIGYHFGSKEALMNEALAESSRRWLREVRSAAEAAPGNGWGDAITAVYRVIQDGRSFAVAYLEAWAQADRAPELRDQLATHYREFRSATAALIATVVRRDDSATQADSEALATILLAVADGLMVQWLLDPDALPHPDRLANALAPLIPGAAARASRVIV